MRSIAVSDESYLNSAEVVRREPSQIDAAMQSIREALVGLQFGEVTVVMQDGVVVQLERTERRRFRKGQR